MRLRLRLLTLCSVLLLPCFSASTIKATAAQASAPTDMDVTASTQLRLLELKYFDHTFDNDAASDRVDRIENLVRGEVSQGTPQERVKRLAQALTADGESLSQPMNEEQALSDSGKNKSHSGQTQSPARDNNASPSAFETGNYPKVTNLEKEILQQTYEGQPLSTRLARLETKAFGTPSPNSDLGDRTDRLEDYAEKTLHDKPFAINQDIDKPYVLNRSAPSAAPGAQEAIEHFFNMNRGLGSGFAGQPGSFGGGGFGPPGQSQVTSFSQMDEDPAAFQKDPPPPNTRMLTRVAWCEVQTFGHTFPNMHLTRRLRQLSDEVLPKNSKLSDMQLMDDLDPIEKAVIARKSGHPNAS